MKVVIDINEGRTVEFKDTGMHDNFYTVSAVDHRGEGLVNGIRISKADIKRLAKSSNQS